VYSASCQKVAAQEADQASMHGRQPMTTFLPSFWLKGM